MLLKITSFICSVAVSAVLLLSCQKAPQKTILPDNSEISEASCITSDFDDDDYYRPYPEAVSIDLSAGEPAIVTSSGSYRYSGTLENGSISVNVDKATDNGAVYIILDNAHITSTAPINITEAEKVVVILENGTTNTLTQTLPDSETEIPDAALYSKADLTITGKGNLEIVSEHNDGINSRDDLKITDGNITVTSLGDGIVGKDSVYVENGTLAINSGKDGIRSTNTESKKGFTAIYGGSFNIVSVDDCIQAAQNIYIENGSFTLTSGGGYIGITDTQNDNMNGFGGRPHGEFPKGERPQRMPDGKMPPEFKNREFSEGEIPPIPREEMQLPDTAETETDTVKAVNCDGKLYITGGSFEISSSHDAVSSVGDIVIDGGSFSIAAGDDALRSDACITVNGGEIIINNCYEGLEAQNITVNGAKTDITSADDGININASGGSFTMNSGEIFIYAGGDGIDSNGSIALGGGKIVIDISKTGRADTPIDYQTSYENNGCTVTDISGNAVAVSNMPPHGGFGRNERDKLPSREPGTNTEVAIIGDNKI